MAQTDPLPKTPESRKLVTGTDELRAAVIDVVSRARRTIAILTPNLEPEIYEHDDFLAALRHFVLAKSFSRVRVLITEPKRAIKPGNQFVQIGQRLNSYIEFRSLSAELQPEVRAYCIADSNTLVYRANHASGEGMLALQAPGIAILYLNEFDDLWNAS